MKFISIDVGIRNLSFCLFECSHFGQGERDNTLRILKWEVVNLLQLPAAVVDTATATAATDDTARCGCSGKTARGDPCKMTPALVNGGRMLCMSHAKKEGVLLLSDELKPAALKRHKLPVLLELAEKHGLVVELPRKKANIIAQLTDFAERQCFRRLVKETTVVATSATGNNAKRQNLTIIGRNIQSALDTLLGEEHATSIDLVIIENQIGPLANRMKTVQGMLVQYFIMRNRNVDVEFISAAEKLKLPVALTLLSSFRSGSGSGSGSGTHAEAEAETIANSAKGGVNAAANQNYKLRKKVAVATCEHYVTKDIRFMEWESFFRSHRKKDDIADSGLQGIRRHSCATKKNKEDDEEEKAAVE